MEKETWVCILIYSFLFYINNIYSVVEIGDQFKIRRFGLFNNSERITNLAFANYKKIEDNNITIVSKTYRGSYLSSITCAVRFLSLKKEEKQLFYQQMYSLR
jgi:hypothetical protein